MRLLLATAVAVGLAFLSATATGDPLPRCHTSQLRLRDDGGQGAAGTGFLSLSLRNTGRRCRTMGYPGVRFLDAHHRTVTRHADEDPNVPNEHGPRRVVLRHGGFAHVTIMAPNAPPRGKPRCPRARYVRLYPPDERAALVARVRHAPGCVTRISVSPVSAGRRHIGV